MAITGPCGIRKRALDALAACGLTATVVVAAGYLAWVVGAVRGGLGVALLGDAGPRLRVWCGGPICRRRRVAALFGIPATCRGKSPDMSVHARLALATTTAAMAGLVEGVATSFLETVLPDSVSPVANSGAPWFVAGLIVVLLLRTTGGASIGLGAVVLVGEVIGYYAASSLRGSAETMSIVAFWAIAALVFGALAGLAAWWLRSDDAWWRTLGTVMVAGVLLGESGRLALRNGADLVPYGVGEAVVGIGCMFWGVAFLARTTGQRATGLLGTAVVGVTVYALYALSL